MCATSAGEMVPLRSIADLRIVVGPQVITRYNNYRSVTINGGPAPGVSSGDGAGGDGRRCRPRRCRRATASNGPAPPIRSTRPRGQTGIILAMAVLFAFLFLVGLYESWIIPIPVLLSVVGRRARRLRRHPHRRA